MMTMMSNPKHQKRMMMTTNLPEELLDDILCRIPAAYLMQLRSTCKRWNGLFKDKSFSRKHIDTAAKQFMFIIKMTTKKLRFCSMTVNLNANPTISKFGAFDTLSSLDQFEIYKVFHCDGLLLFTNKHNNIKVWNPCTGQTKWIEPSSNRDPIGEITYTLGSYNSGNDNSYKILSYNRLGETEFEIFEINSNLWKTLDVTPDGTLLYYGVSLKGKTYWVAWDKNENQSNMFLVSFDYMTERFGRTHLPCMPNTCYETSSLSVFRDENLSVLLQRKDTSEKEIYIRNMSDDDWSKIVTIKDCPRLDRWLTVCFLVGDENKFFWFCRKHIYKSFIQKKKKNEDDDVDDNEVTQAGSKVENEDDDVDDNEVTQAGSTVATLGSFGPNIIDYVPSLVQIQ